MTKNRDGARGVDLRITLVGIDHKTSPVSVRERFAFASEEAPSALRDLAATFGGGAALLSTCNRTEVYLTGQDGIEAGAVVDRLRALKGGAEVPADAFYHLIGREAARHLFRVAAGIESMVVGESEVLGQVRGAFTAATSAESSDAVLARLFHSAIRVGRRARNDTHIGRHATSISSTAVALARRTLGELTCRTVFVVGAGEAGKLTARNLSGSGISRLLVTSRRPGRARGLAEDLDGEPVAFSHLVEALGQADIVISCSAAPDFLIGKKETARAMAGRAGRPLLFIDIAVPRDVDPVVREEPGVHLYDIDDLQAVAEHNMKARRREVAKVEIIVDGELERFSEWVRVQGVVPTVAALRARADGIRQQEIARTMKRLRDLTPEQRESVESMANALTKKLLHHPIARLKGADGERFAGQVRELFSLDGDDAGDHPDSTPEA